MNSTFNNISFDNQMDLFNSLSPDKVSQTSPALPTSSLSPSKTPPENFICGGCKNIIKDKYMLEGNNQYWHEDCLQCVCCRCRLGEVGNTFYFKKEMTLCQRDYMRLFGVSGTCTSCKKHINAYDYVMWSKNNVYHLECFCCSICNQKFCVGDKYFEKDGKIICLADYQKHFVEKEESNDEDDEDIQNNSVSTIHNDYNYVNNEVVSYISL
uniref:LIM zinc-binding domain-containing protein n=1 Tax=Strongyloides stercoralis TaxID=6248 RepID=A0A0K0EGE1_STRER